MRWKAKGKVCIIPNDYSVLLKSRPKEKHWKDGLLRKTLLLKTFGGKCCFVALSFLSTRIALAYLRLPSSFQSLGTRLISATKTASNATAL